MNTGSQVMETLPGRLHKRDAFSQLVRAELSLPPHCVEKRQAGFQYS
jgi:hypothetical protein